MKSADRLARNLVYARSARPVLALVVAVGSLAGCGGEDPPDDQDQDKTRPTTTLEAHPEALVASRAAEFVFSGDDDVALAGFECALDGADWTACTSPASYTDLADGKHSFSVRAVDKAGNVDDDPPSWSWEIDASAPLGSLTFAASLTNDIEVKATLVGADANGPVEVRLSGDVVEEDEWKPLATEVTLKLTPDDGLKTISVTFRDALGNESEPHEETVTLDRTPPTGTLSLATSLTRQTQVEVALTVDELNGPVEMRLSGDVAGEDEWKPFDENPSVTLLIVDGVKTVSVELRDAAGNVSELLSETVELDQTPPSGTLSVAAPVVTEPQVELTLTAEDPNGPVEMRLSGDVLDEDQWKPFEATPRVTLTEGDGPKTITVELRDAPGNVSEPLSGTVALYAEPLVATIDVLSEVTSEQEVEIALTVFGAEGAVEMRLLGDVAGEGAWRPFEPSTSVTLFGDDGVKEVLVILRDETGRVSAAAMDTVVLDSLAPGANRWRSSSAGAAHTCAIKADGTLWCAGNNEEGQLGDGTSESQPAPVQEATGANDWSRVDAGESHTCAIKTDGTLWCWGRNEEGQLGIGERTEPVLSPVQEMTGANDWARLHAGYLRTCAVKTDGTLWCWGFNNDGELGDASRTNRSAPRQEASKARDWFQVSGGNDHTCAVKTTGSLWCWGKGGGGRLGTGDTSNARSPVRLETGGDEWVSVAVGERHSCALDGGGSLWCWGYNGFGQLGDGTTTVQPAPTRVPVGDGEWAAVVAGNMFTCGLRGDGSLWCWGRNEYGTLATGDTSDRHEPTQEAAERRNWRSVSAGGAHSCGVNDTGTVLCWGVDGAHLARGEEGDAGSRSTPTQETSGRTDWASVSAGANHTCARRSSGDVACWGSSGNDRLGDPVSMPGDWSVISSGGTHNCGVKLDGTLWCWGNEGEGRLGSGIESTDSQATPVQEASKSQNWSTVAVGNAHSCAVKTDGTLWCWGRNANGQLGDDSTATAFAPVQEALGHTDWSTVAAGSNHSCAVKTDGSLWCWGSNTHGRLGDGGEEKQHVPTREATKANDWVSVSAGGAHTCAVKVDSSAWCWGLNTNGRLGDGTDEKRLLPTAVKSTNHDWASVSAGLTHTCGVRLDGRLFCWGAGADGRLGLPVQADVNEPVSESTQTSDWVSVSAGGSHTCATRSDGSLFCWGNNALGQLGTERSPIVPGSILRSEEITAPSSVSELVVTLVLDAVDAHSPVEMLLDGDITDDFKGEWIDFASEVEVSLVPGAGPKTLSVRFRDGLGQESEAFTTAIVLE